MRSVAQPVQKRITVVLRTHQVAEHEQVGHPRLAVQVVRGQARSTKDLGMGIILIMLAHSAFVRLDPPNLVRRVFLL